MAGFKAYEPKVKANVCANLGEVKAEWQRIFALDAYGNKNSSVSYKLTAALNRVLSALPSNCWELDEQDGHTKAYVPDESNENKLTCIASVKYNGLAWGGFVGIGNGQFMFQLSSGKDVNWIGSKCLAYSKREDKPKIEQGEAIDWSTI